MKALFLILFLMMVFSSFEGLASEAPDGTDLRLGDLTSSQQSYWSLLLHESPRSPGRSEIDSPDFFLAPSGQSNFGQELRATIEFLRKPSEFRSGRIPQHPQCLFPERTRFIKEVFSQAGIPAQFPEVSCPEFQDWKGRFNPVELSLIYAAPYLGSPASMFGHTFLRMKSHHPVAPLDYAISFEASAGEAGGIIYALYGLTGMYPGVFNVLPYHMKIQQYSAMESRDLWEYDLPVSTEGMSRMLNHLWELGPQYMFYYFFDENCSYHLLSLIEVASQSHFRKEFRWMAIPSDTLAAAVPKPERFALRPSLSNTLKQRLSVLSPEERRLFFHLAQAPLDATPETPAAVLDATIDGLRLKQATTAAKLFEATGSAESHLLSLRAQLPVTPQPPALVSTAPWPPNSSPPHDGHATSKLGIALGGESSSDESISFVDLKFRPAIHDEIDPSDGHLRFSSLAIGRLSLRVLRRDRTFSFFLSELTLAEVKSLGPPPPLGFPSVWHIAGGFAQPLDLGCRECGVLRVRGGWGLSSTLGLNSWNWMGLLNANLEGGTALRSRARFLPSLQILGLLDSHQLRMSLSTELLRRIAREDGRDLGNESPPLFFLTEIKISLLRLRTWDLRAQVQYLSPLEAPHPWRSQIAFELHRFY